MLQLMTDLPPYVVAVKATGNITKEDYENILMPAVEKVDELYKEINFIMVLETSISNFTWGAWMNDAKMSLKKYAKWNKVAVVTDEKIASLLSYAFGLISPSESRGFTLAELEQAKQWVAERTTAS